MDCAGIFGFQLTENRALGLGRSHLLGRGLPWENALYFGGKYHRITPLIEIIGPEAPSAIRAWCLAVSLMQYRISDMWSCEWTSYTFHPTHDNIFYANLGKMGRPTGQFSDEFYPDVVLSTLSETLRPRRRAILSTVGWGLGRI